MVVNGARGVVSDVNRPPKDWCAQFLADGGSALII
jgi:hypothetical protein